MMFDKQKFSDILNKIVKEYDSITEFTALAGVGRSYISKFIHLKMSTPPSPKVLRKIADASKDITTYNELMYLCGHLNITKEYNINFPQNASGISVVPEIISKLHTLSDIELDKVNEYIDFIIIQKKK